MSEHNYLEQAWCQLIVQFTDIKGFFPFPPWPYMNSFQRPDLAFSYSISFNQMKDPAKGIFCDSTLARYIDGLRAGLCISVFLLDSPNERLESRPAAKLLGWMAVHCFFDFGVFQVFTPSSKLHPGQAKSIGKLIKFSETSYGIG